MPWQINSVSRSVRVTHDPHDLDRLESWETTDNLVGPFVYPDSPHLSLWPFKPTRNPVLPTFPLGTHWTNFRPGGAYHALAHPWGFPPVVPLHADDLFAIWGALDVFSYHSYTRALRYLNAF